MKVATVLSTDSPAITITGARIRNLHELDLPTIVTSYQSSVMSNNINDLNTLFHIVVYEA